MSAIFNPGRLPPGALVLFAGSTVPADFLECDGTAVSRTTYADLFAAVGTTWGVGDGSTTFNLPDLRGRAPIGAGQGSGLTNRALAAVGGAETHTLTAGEMPAHTHGYGQLVSNTAVGGTANRDLLNANSSALQTSSAGSGAAHNNMMPFAVVKFIIRT